MGEDKKIMLDRLLEKVGMYMDAFTENSYADSEIGRVLKDALSTRGKMIRPRLVLLSGMYGSHFEENADRLCKLAAMVEITHMASLVHDDIVDDAPFRRGKPSVQQKYGKNEAVYAGDFMISRISYQLLKEGLNEAGIVLVQAVEQMCVGEIGQSMCRYDENVTKEAYLSNIHGKTAALMMAACKVGAMESGCSNAVIQLLERFGECLGLIFQLRDDMLDYTSDISVMGKSAQMDFLEGIYTMPVLCVMEQEEARGELLPYLQANAENRMSWQKLENVRDIVRFYKGIERTEAMICTYREEAEAILKALAGENGTASEMLLNMMDVLLQSKG